MSSDEEEEVFEKAGGGGETPGSTRPKEKGKEVRLDVKAYEESPPKDAGPKEFRYSQWFIDEKWRVVEPRPGRKSGKTKAFVWKLDQKFF